ncbi:hypothetical protein RRG08_004868 [Elysia crispata]|uniref:Uncharacterized protein n=1 Tax=Elysia crispata TaxID=231223 RepID=A0AAE1B873_9GAST|nr:hypothetical protein RRG08_004868 [Elysia crispata]
MPVGEPHDTKLHNPGLDGQVSAITDTLTDLDGRLTCLVGQTLYLGSKVYQTVKSFLFPVVFREGITEAGDGCRDLNLGLQEKLIVNVNMLH